MSERESQIPLARRRAVLPSRSSSRNRRCSGWRAVAVVGLIPIALWSTACQRATDAGGTASDQFTTAEAQEILRLLQEDPEFCDDFLNHDICKGSRERHQRHFIPLQLLEQVIGKPNTSWGQGKSVWVYRTRDGSIQIKRDRFVCGSDEGWPGEYFSFDRAQHGVPFLTIEGIENAMSSNPNAPIDRAKLRGVVREAKRRYDAATQDVKSTVLENRARAAKIAAQQEQVAKHADQQEQEKEHKSALVLAAKMLGDVPSRPRILFSAELGIQESALQLSANAEGLAKALEAGQKHGKWEELLDFLKVEHDRRLSRQNIEAAYEQLGKASADIHDAIKLPCLVATSRDLGRCVWYSDTQLGGLRDPIRPPERKRPAVP